MNEISGSGYLQLPKACIGEVYEITSPISLYDFVNGKKTVTYEIGDLFIITDWNRSFGNSFYNIMFFDGNGMTTSEDGVLEHRRLDNFPRSRLKIKEYL